MIIATITAPERMSGTTALTRSARKKTVQMNALIFLPDGGVLDLQTDAMVTSRRRRCTAIIGTPRFDAERII